MRLIWRSNQTSKFGAWRARSGVGWPIRSFAWGSGTGIEGSPGKVKLRRFSGDERAGIRDEQVGEVFFCFLSFFSGRGVIPTHEILLGQAYSGSPVAPRPHPIVKWTKSDPDFEFPVNTNQRYGYHDCRSLCEMDFASWISRPSSGLGVSGKPKHGCLLASSQPNGGPGIQSRAYCGQTKSISHHCCGIKGFIEPLL